MLEPVSTGVAITLLVKSAPAWLPAISEALIPPVHDAILGKITERAFDRLGEQRRKLFHLDEKEQKRHLELALKNAAERGLAPFQTKEEQQKYNEVIGVLSTSHADTLRREALRLFTLDDEPDFKKFATLFDQARSQAQPAQGQAIDVTPYLSNFFESLKAELYADPYFRQQMSDVLRVRAEMGMQRSLTEVLSTLNQIGETLADDYTPEQFEKDVQAYTAHIERTLRYLKLVGVVPKERTNENRDPELGGIFVPLRISMQENIVQGQQVPDSLVDLLAQASCMILLGGPGSGKSTATRHLAWSHAVSNLSNSRSLTNTPLLSGKPLPLRIELRRLNEDRRQRPDYDFLTYASEVLLGRAGLNIPPQMFELLLERRTMLLLFDGLDEVATLDDRRTLVEEIDSFARQYPGNRFLVTSRPVGYNLAPLSTQIFSEAHVQPFDDGQIHLFLENWYAHVLRLSPLSPDDWQELEELHTNLKDNPRLHVLAENPLLLTVITALHRYERLPDKRILVYDRCADLLLETWARLKGTNTRWQDLKLGKEDQYACVAHLGFVLHERSQQESSAEAKGTGTQSNRDLANDVPSKFMLREIERFLRHQNLFSSIAEQNKQASRFLDLIKEEAGLIVERGTDENGESLYGFVHRTFQEYFAAADVYERYQQEEDATIISDFLREHLHDPHWQEVILLLFGKLKRRPVTNQLRQILEGKIQSRRSKYTEIVQQDLFFVCDCLLEEISVENELAEYVISCLSDLVKNTLFPSQCSQVLNILIRFKLAPKYTDLGKKALIALLTAQNVMSDATKWTDVAWTLYIYSHSVSDERDLIIQKLVEKARQPGFSVEQVLQAIKIFYPFSHTELDLRQHTLLLMAIARRTNLSIEESINIAQELYTSSLSGSEEQHFAVKLLLDLQRLSDISVEQAMQVANVWLNYIYREVSSQSKKHRRAVIQWALSLARKYNVPIEQFVLIIKALYMGISSLSYPEERQQAAKVFLKLLLQPELSFEETLLVISNILIHNFSLASKQQAIKKLLNFFQQPDLTYEQTIDIVKILCMFSTPSSKAQQKAIQKLSELVQRASIPYEQTVRTACDVYENLCKNGLFNSIRYKSAQILLRLLQQRNLPFEQQVLVAWTLCTFSPGKSKEYERGYRELLNLAQKPSIPSEKEVLAAQALYRSNHVESFEQGKYLLKYMAQQSHYSSERAVLAVLALLSSRGGFNTQYQYFQDELELVQRLLEILQHSEPPLEQAVQAALFLHQYYLSNFDHSGELQQVVHILLDMARRPSLHFKQTLQITRILYERSQSRSAQQCAVTQTLWELAQNQRFTIDQRLQIATIPLTTMRVSYSDRVQAVQALFILLQVEAARRYFERYWQQINLSYPDNIPGVSDIPSIFELAMQELLPTRARNEMYQLLRQMVPQFSSLEEVYQ